MSLVTWSQPHVSQSRPSTCPFHHIPGIIVTMPLTSSGFGGQLFYSAAALQGRDGQCKSCSTYVQLSATWQFTEIRWQSCLEIDNAAT